jgi:HemY protein
LVPAAALAGRVLAEGGELRKASRVVNKAWEAQPHPDLAEVLANLRFGDAARDRLKRIETLAKKVPGHIESALALARAALDAQEFAKARDALASHLVAPTKRVALLLAEIERAGARSRTAAGRTCRNYFRAKAGRRRTASHCRGPSLSPLKRAAAKGRADHSARACP